MENIERPKIRNLKDELIKLGLTDALSDDVLKWVDTIPVRVYNTNIKVGVKNGTVRVNEDSVVPDDLSFNTLPWDLKIYYQWDNGYFHNPFDLPDGIILYNPFTGAGLRHNKGGEPTPANDINGEKIQRNPFNGNICGKFLYKDGKALKRWIVNDNNEWEEKTIEN